MVEQDGGTLRKVAWSELFPWLILARCFRIAIQVRLLVLGAAGVLVTASGWAFLGLVFPASYDGSPQLQAHRGCPWLAVTDAVPKWPAWLYYEPQQPSQKTSERLQAALLQTANPWEDLSRPFRGIFEPVVGPKAVGPEKPETTSGQEPEAAAGESSKGAVEEGVEPTAGEESAGRPTWDTETTLGRIARVFVLLLYGLWALAVWAFFGGAITRSAALQLATRQTDRPMTTLRFAAARWRYFFMAPLVPLIGVAIVTLLMAIPSVLLRVGLGTVLVAVLVWPLLLLGGLAIAWVLLGLALGWPLLWAHLSVEGGDSLDPLSPMYGYLFRRPLHYLFYVGVAALLGGLGWLLVGYFAAGTIAATYWAASWTAGEVRTLLIAWGDPGLGPVSSFGGLVIRFWVQCVKLIAVGFLYSYFWTASTAIYFLLRYDVDQKEMDEVLPEEEEQQPAELPPLASDAAGAPVVEEGETPREEAGEQP